jgi:hypothetical protein
VLVAACLLAAAGWFAADRLFGGEDEAAARASGESSSPATDGEPSEGGETGRAADAFADLQPVSVRATCQAPPGVDSAGSTITYEPELTLDALDATAWRCPGSAVGHQLVFDFGRTVTVTSLGLVPGYAKVDPVDGTDRFQENRTVTAVTWRFDDGTTQRQTIAAPAPTMTTVEPAAGVETRTVVLEIAGTGNSGAIRDFTAISEVRFTGS